jgi:hypothetical protein
MKSKTTEDRFRSIVILIFGTCVTGLILLIMNKDYPFVGHDYRYFIPRLLDTNLHIQLNGLSIQWYTPSFGGGLPAFPNPQHIEYSIVQWLTMLLNPWSAILVSTAGISLVGYYFCYKFLTDLLELNWRAAILGAMFFIGNGFYIEHMVTGMIGYQLFPLGAVILYFLIDQRNHYFYNAIIIAIVLALMVHQAGFYLIITFILSFSMTLPFLFFYKPSLFNARRTILVASGASLLFTTMISSKVYATYAFMQYFPRIVSDTYEVETFQALVGIVAQLFGVMTLGPFLIITGHNPEYLSGALSRITGTKYGIWETDSALSPVLIFFLLVGLARAVSERGRNIRSHVNRFALVRFVLLLVPITVTLQMILAKGMMYTITKQLPILESLHVNLRFTSALILPLIILGAIQLHRFFLQNSKPAYFWACAFLTSMSLLSYFSLSNVVIENDYSVSFSNVLHQEMRKGMKFPVMDISDSPIARWNGFSEYSSIYQPYEPIFGYELESFHPEVHPGKILESRYGYFNMTNPASLVFPEINNLKLYERIKVTERDQLELLLERRQPRWKIPLIQKALNEISLWTAMLSIGVLLASNVNTIRNILKHRISKKAFSFFS